MFTARVSHPRACFAMPWVSKLWITVYINYWRHVFIKASFCENVCHLIFGILTWLVDDKQHDLIDSNGQSVYNYHLDDNNRHSVGSNSIHSSISKN